MLLYCRDGIVLATHADAQSVPASLYGAGVIVVPVPDGTTCGPGDPAPAVGPDMLTAYAAQMRWARETGGAVWNGLPIHTDVPSQTKYLAELQAVALGVRADGEPWKFADGLFRPVGNADIQALAVAAREHVRACFAVEAEVVAGIAAGTITGTAAIDAAFASVGAAP